MIDREFYLFAIDDVEVNESRTSEPLKSKNDKIRQTTNERNVQFFCWNFPQNIKPGGGHE